MLERPWLLARLSSLAEARCCSIAPLGSRALRGGREKHTRHLLSGACSLMGSQVHRPLPCCANCCPRGACQALWARVVAAALQRVLRAGPRR